MAELITEVHEAGVCDKYKCELWDYSTGLTGVFQHHMKTHHECEICGHESTLYRVIKVH